MMTGLEGGPLDQWREESAKIEYQRVNCKRSFGYLERSNWILQDVLIPVELH